MITATAGLETGETKLSEEFPVETGAVVDGRRSPTPTTSPAAAPCSRASPTPATASSPRSASGSAATRWSRRPSCSASTRRRPSTTPRRWPLTDPPVSSIPKTFESDLDLAVSSIGQGQVQATPLSMASASQAIADGGVRSPTAIVKDPELSGDYPTVKVMSPRGRRRDEADDDRGRQLRHRRRRLAPRRPGGGQDRHRRARHILGRDHRRHARPSWTSTPGSPPSPPPTSRSSRSRSRSSTRPATAARWPPR